MQKKLAVLISNAGIGTNLQAIIDGVEGGKINAEVVVVISDAPDAFGLERAKKHNIPTKVISKEEGLEQILKELQVDYICLAGWKSFIRETLIDEYKNRILNVHPGLIPDTIMGEVRNPDGTRALWNKGKFTEKAIQNFLDSKATYAGSTVHFLSKEFDFGEVLERGFVKIEPGDSVETLYPRLKQEENRIYTEALKKLCKS